MKEIYDKDSEATLRKQKLEEQTELWLQKASNSATYVIPVVFHILHQDGPENISDDQVKDALRILNRDYAKENPDTAEIIPVFKSLADSTKIQFALATKDANGVCTSGIIHHYDIHTDWYSASASVFAYTWNPTRYLNVYVVRSITLSSGDPTSAYAYYPGTWPTGSPRDAAVILNNYLGSVGTSNGMHSRVLTHEVGHWLNLYHVFGFNNSVGVDCSGSDLVSDTPPTQGYLQCPDAAIATQYQVCTPGLSENFQNYMDYSFCSRMFTQGQALRMQTTLQSNVSGRNNLWTNANLQLTGVVNPVTVCVPNADFKYSRSITCVNTPIIFTDASWNGQPSSYTWSFPGGTPATSSFSAPVVTYAGPGLYSVTYSVSNSAGSSLPVTKTNLIAVTADVASYSGAWAESFENLPLPNSDWVLNSSSGGTAWETTSLAAYDGVYGARISKTNNTSKAVTSMIGPGVDLSSIPNPLLSFRLAAVENRTDHVNALKVYSSIDCGDTWNLIYTKTGMALVTTSNVSADYVPAGIEEWQFELIDLSNVASSDHTRFKFEYVRDSIADPNNIYIDDINIISTTPLNNMSVLQSRDIKVFPNPSDGNFSVSVTLPAKQQVKFSLTDALGRTLKTFDPIELETGESKYDLYTGIRLNQGIYFLKVESNQIRCTKKVIIE